MKVGDTVYWRKGELVTPYQAEGFKAYKVIKVSDRTAMASDGSDSFVFTREIE